MTEQLSKHVMQRYDRFVDGIEAVGATDRSIKVRNFETLPIFIRGHIYDVTPPTQPFLANVLCYPTQLLINIKERCHNFYTLVEDVSGRPYVSILVMLEFRLHCQQLELRGQSWQLLRRTLPGQCLSLQRPSTRDAA